MDYFYYVERQLFSLGLITLAVVLSRCIGTYTNSELPTFSIEIVTISCVSFVFIGALAKKYYAENEL